MGGDRPRRPTGRDDGQGRADDVTNIDDHPMVPPLRHRVICRFYLLPIVVANRERWFEYVRVVQRLEPADYYSDGRPFAGSCRWVDVGFYDELFPAKGSAMEEV
jgi:hypothetical protein